MLERILPDFIMQVVRARLNFNKLYELRLRAELPVCVNYDGRYYFFGKSGLVQESGQAFVFDSKAIADVVTKACEHSVYAAANQMNSGFITVDGGVRLGLCGEIVCDGGYVRAVKNIHALNIRLPHQVEDCCEQAFRFIADPSVNNTLIISPPGCGKTTYIRDIARKLGTLGRIHNVLLIDERNEVAAVNKGVACMNVGFCTDVITNCSKEYGFMQGIRAMRPDVIITDEIAKDDIDALFYALSCGVKVIATIHACDHLDLSVKDGIKDIVAHRLFTRYVDLSDSRGPGTLEGVYDEQFNRLYYPKCYKR